MILAQTLGSGIYDDTAPVLDFTGTWADTPLDGAYLDAHAVGAGVGAELAADFVGSAITLYFVRWADGGEASLCVNDDCSTVAHYDVATSVASITVSGLGAGVHDFSYRVSSGNGSVDAIYVAPNEIAAGPVYDEFITIDGVTGRLVRELTAGDVLLASLLVVILLVTVGTFIMGAVSNER